MSRAKVEDAYGDKVTVAEAGGYVRVGTPHYGTGTRLTNFYTVKQSKVLRKALKAAEKAAKA